MKTIRKAAQISDLQAEDRTFTVIASDETIDRYGDIVRAGGWDLSAFKNNPIALWSHDHQNPIGTVPEVWVEDSKLMAKMQLAPEGTDPFIDKLWNLVKAKVLRAVSVGFAPTVEPEPIYEGKYLTGFEYVAQELLELSLVTVPANPSALALAKNLTDDLTIARVFTSESARERNALHMEMSLKIMASRSVDLSRF